MANESRLPPEDVRQAAAKVEAYVTQQENRRVTDAEFVRMSSRERIDYCRRFPQSSLPAWRDPRSV
jgi:hypothetical protein